jgi:hypothetical protein
MPDHFEAIGARMREIRGSREVSQAASITIAHDATARTWLYGLARSRLLVDGRPVGSLCGRSACKTIPLEPGEHRINVRVERSFNFFCYPGKRLDEQRIELAAGEELKLTLGMDQEFKRSFVRSQFQHILFLVLASIVALEIGVLAWAHQPVLMEAVTAIVIRFELDERTIPILYRLVRTPGSSAFYAVISYCVMLVLLLCPIRLFLARQRRRALPGTSYVLIRDERSEEPEVGRSLSLPL